MGKQLHGVIPSGAPWGGPESVSLMSCFASMLLAIEGLDETRPLYCCQGPGQCTRCGRCKDFNWSQKYHEQVYHLYLTLSGLACLTLWPKSGDTNPMHKPWLVMPMDEALRRAMDFTGYQYTDTTIDTAEIISASIDAGRPALVYGLDGEDWIVATGYDDDGITDAAGKHYPLAGATRVVAVTGRKGRRTGLAEEFHYLADVLRKPDIADTEYVAGLAVYDAVDGFLNNDGFFQQADQAALEEAFGQLHALIGMLAEDRCFASMAMLEGLYGHELVEGWSSSALSIVGGFFMETHNQCWGAWAALGGNYMPEPEKNAGLLRDRSVRDKLLQYFATFRKHDEVAALLLEAVADTPFLRPTK